MAAMSFSEPMPWSARETSSCGAISASRTESQNNDQVTARASGSVNLSIPATRALRDISSRRTFAKVRSPSFSRTTSRRARPTRAGTSVRSPETSVST